MTNLCFLLRAVSKIFIFFIFIYIYLKFLLILKKRIPVFNMN